MVIAWGMPRPGLRDGVGMAGVGLVVAGDDQGRQLERLELRQAVERDRARHLANAPGQRLGIAMELHPLAGDPEQRLALIRVDARDRAS